MFKQLHALAKKATLMIVVTAEDDQQLRVNVTPTQVDLASKTGALRPLSLLGTPEELDEGFEEALTVWQAPRRSLVEQAAAAAGAPDEKPKAVPKATKVKPAPAPAKAPKAARGKKTAAEPDGIPGENDDDQENADDDTPPGDSAAGDAADGAGETTATSDGAAADAEPAGESPSSDDDAAAEPAVDVFTLDLF